MEQLKSYISYIVGILGFAGIIWTYASKSAGKEYSVVNLKADVVKIQTEMLTKHELKVFSDSISYYNYRMEQKVKTLIISNNNLRNSYVNYLKRDKTLKLDDFLKFMNGIEWVVSPIEDKRIDSLSFNIKIKKK